MPKDAPFFIEIGQGLSMRVGLPSLASWDSASRPQKARPGTFGFNFQTNSLEYWDGSFWWTAQMIVD